MKAIKIFAQLALLGTAAKGATHALGPCSNVTLDGDYAFSMAGRRTRFHYCSGRRTQSAEGSSVLRQSTQNPGA